MERTEGHAGIPAFGLPEKPRAHFDGRGPGKGKNKNLGRWNVVILDEITDPFDKDESFAAAGSCEDFAGTGEVGDRGILGRIAL